MKLLTEDAVLVCAHTLGVVRIASTQEWVTVESRRVLIEANPEGRSITGCPNVGPTIKPCGATMAVRAGYSDLLHIDGKRICLDTVTGLTDGTPPGVVKYQVLTPGQAFISEG